MENDKFLSAKRYAEITMELLTKHAIPPTPINYSVFFLYTNGSQPLLNQQINLQIKQNKALDCIFIEALFNQFVSNSEQVNHGIINPLNDSINSLLTKIDAQVTQDEEAVNNLRKIDSALEKSNQPASLNKVVNYLLNTINNSTNQHKNLSEELNKTNGEVSELREKLKVARKEAISDALTGLLNRRGCEERLQQIDLEETHTSLAIDIDHFKKINDNFGHFIGDKVLQRVANSIKTNISDADLAVRYGGEEFVVVMVNKTVLEAKVIAEKIRLSISNLKLKQRNSDQYLPQISVSVGIAENKGESCWLELFKRADDALYQAKSSGRNCSMIAT
ncbi:MAG: GGDEF domain-containing protein [Thalassotalea sp.]